MERVDEPTLVDAPIKQELQNQIDEIFRESDFCIHAIFNQILEESRNDRKTSKE